MATLTQENFAIFSHVHGHAATVRITHADRLARYNRPWFATLESMGGILPLTVGVGASMAAALSQLAQQPAATDWDSEILSLINTEFPGH